MRSGRPGRGNELRLIHPWGAPCHVAASGLSQQSFSQLHPPQISYPQNMGHDACGREIIYQITAKDTNSR